MKEKSLRTLNTSLDSLLSSMLETHWIQSCNFKDKVMNKEARTIAINPSQNFSRCLLVIHNYKIKMMYMCLIIYLPVLHASIVYKATFREQKNSFCLDSCV